MTSILGPAGLTVVKIGGSLAFSPELRRWLAACRSAPVILVPGGGPFADAVRSAQARIRLTDRAAHRMALLAMAQYAEALASLEPGFAVADTTGAIHTALDKGLSPVWAPLHLLNPAEGVEESWDFTSDSLAAWLALKLGARRLMLVKRAGLALASASPVELSNCGIVDRAFARVIAGTDLAVVCVSAAEPERLAEVLRCEARARRQCLPLPASCF